jgi:peptide/nickel transport system substrate-binding protein
MRVRLAVGLATAAAALVAAGCTGGSVSGSGSPTAGSGPGAVIRVMTLGLDQPEPSLDLTKNVYAAWVTSNVEDTVMAFTPQGGIRTNLAASWAEPNAETYIYHLRRNVKFSNGDPLTSQDVVYSWNYGRRAGSEDAFAFPYVKDISADGPYTVVVRLTQPDDAWKYWPAQEYAEVFDAAAAQRNHSAFGTASNLPIGSGPWEIKSYDPTTGAELVPNPNWWGPARPVNTVVYKFFSSTTSEALAYRAGEVDFVPWVTNAKVFATTSGAKLLTAVSCSNGLLSFNTQMPPWNNVDVRRAAAYAINRAAIITALGGYAEPVYTMIPPAQLATVGTTSQVTALLNAIPQYRYDPAKAKQELARSPYPHGVTATMLGDTFSSDELVDQVIVYELGKVGIHVQLKINPTYSNYLNVMTGRAATRPTTYASYNGCFSPDPSNYSDFLGSQNLAIGEYNSADYAPADVDHLLSEGVATTSNAARFSIYAALVRQLQNDLPYVGLYVADEEMGLSPKYSYTNYGPYTSVGPYMLGVKSAR